jgi:intein/homing endonuclease
MSESINEVTLALELLVTFAGVFLAFMLDRLIDYRKEQRIKHVLLRNLAHELNRLKEALSGEAKRLGHDVYDSAVASGRLNFLASEQLMKITDVYTKIKNADIRAMSVIIAKEAFDQSKGGHSQEEYSSLKNLENAFNIRKQEAIKSIDEILKEPWLSRYAQKS